MVLSARLTPFLPSASFRPALNFTRMPATSSSVPPLRRATSSSALRFSTVAPVASDTSFSASSESTVARVKAVMAAVLKPLTMPTPRPLASELSLPQRASMPAAVLAAMRSALSMPSWSLASRASRSIDRVASAMSAFQFCRAALRRAPCVDHAQVVHQGVHIGHAQPGGHQGQAGPIHAAAAVGQRGPHAARDGLLCRQFRRCLALVLDAGLRGVQQGPQFFACSWRRCR